MKKILLITLCIILAGSTGYSQKKPVLKKATFGMGCFWCTEAVFQRIKGVTKVESGYTGGKIKNPTYEQVSTGKTGHAEVSQITYDPSKISYAELLEIFWKMHDPTTLNRQGADVGTHYRSAIFYSDAQQKAEAEKYKAELNKAKAYPKPIVTQITAAQPFYKAENYHQNYFNLNGRQPYCRAVIQPKIDKLEKVFKDKIK
ncbi:MAG: peptide-methionine (S)-S-oxide reductase MsrA [Daejeonella sp.]|uniref:peptide-methionine (S)-S-oxide reductase MsrA n=1 Tax=Daejeonella sp. TaxID=2805397 RepID=UPI003C749F8D